MAEKEYIEREVALNELKEELEMNTPMYTEEQNRCIDLGLKIAIKDIKRLPTADVVEVVRCKDCKHWHKCLSDDGSVEYIHFSRCTKGNQLANGNNYFCSSGERMTD